MYKPDRFILQKYADLLVNFALNSGRGVKPGEVVQVLVPDVAKPFYGALQRSILQAKAMPLMRLLATGFERDYFNLANQEQLKFFPKAYLKARVKLLDHTISILADKDLKALRRVPPAKIMTHAEAQKPYRIWLFDKEYEGKFTWTVALYGTPAMAKEANLSLTDYWQEIIRACYLDDEQPVKQWQRLETEIKRLTRRLNQLEIETIKITGEGVNLTISLGQQRRFIGGGGRNIPSYEIFTSPDWRGTEGEISFNQPLYRYGNLIQGITLYFHQGKVVKATAKQGQNLLREMLKRPNANKIGEFSLTDKRFSRIRHFMANTLFDENIGGSQGNSHIALGMSYKDAFAGNPKQLGTKLAKSLGFVDSGEHCDIVSTNKRQVDVRLVKGRWLTIYADGSFLI
ncbi:thermophilic metalloprotease (M29) superfamily [Microgenomates group bacterium RBG_16_45_19]|nr:MAG: thermophilic metalloprotease (M29) superfamily [Microgenomates group bacterium RBG_16_45_19]